MSTTTCAPITNNQTLGTFPVMVSKKLGHCLELYSGTNKKCDKMLAGAGAETGDDCIEVNLDSTHPYPNYANCTAPQGNQKTYEIPNCLTQMRHLLAKGISNNSAAFYLCGGNDVFDNILKLINHATPFVLQNTVVRFDSSNTKPNIHPHLLTSIKQNLKNPNFRREMYQHISKNIPELSHIVKNTEQSIIEALNAGMKPEHLLYSTLIDFSKVPAALDMLPKNTILKNLCITILKAFSYELNQNIIKATLRHLPESQIMRFDELFEDLHQRPEHYGLDAKNIENTCVKLGKMPDCFQLLFFNGKHPTNLGHKIITEQIIDTYDLNFLIKLTINWIGDSLSDSGNNIYCNDRRTQPDIKSSTTELTNLFNQYVTNLTRKTIHVEKPHSTEHITQPNFSMSYQ
jgi:hypothetical protein